MTTNTKTDRDIFADLVRTSGWHWGDALVEQSLQERAAEGLEALAALWFRYYEDEQNLPRLLVELYQYIPELGIESDLLDKAIDGEDED